MKRRCSNVSLTATILLCAIFSAHAIAQQFSFQTSQLTIDQNPIKVLAADVNRDGITDLVFLYAQNFTIFLGKGDGTFQTPLKFSHASSYNDFVIADFNRDGKPDIAAIAPASNPGTLTNDAVDVYLGKGDGTFSAPSTWQGRSSANTQLIAMDVNGDGNIDLTGAGFVLLGNGDGSFQLALLTPFGTNSGTASFVLADFNGDGAPDLVVSTAVNTAGLTIVSLALGHGDGTFATPATLFTFQGTANAPSLATGDFNGDHRADLLVQTADGNTLCYLGKGDGTFQAAIGNSNVPAGANVATTIADMDGDGKADIVEAQSGSVSIYLSQGNGKFQSAGTFAAGSSITEVIVTDLNGDGKPDLVALNNSAASSTSTATILLNTTPSLHLGRVQNGASFAIDQPLAPGSLVSLFGSGFTSPTMPLQATTAVLPSMLGNVSVTFNGIPAPLSYVTSTQINAQVPWETTNPATVVVTVNGVSAAPLTVQIAPIAPGIFASNGQAIAINLDGTLAANPGAIPGLTTHPASPGDTIILLATGLGPVTPSISNGAPSNDRLRTTATPVVLIGGVPALVTFAGLSPQFAGVNQLNVVVPQVLDGIQAVQINAGGILTTPQTTMAVSNP